MHRASLLAPARAAGGDAEEVAAANPQLSAAVPAMLGSGPKPPSVYKGGGMTHDVEGGGGGESLRNERGEVARGAGMGAADAGGGGERGGASGGGGGLVLSDGSGMDVPELAVLPGGRSE